MDSSCASQTGYSAKGSSKNNLAESAALNPTGDLTNAQFPMLNSHPKWMSDCQMFHRCKARTHAAASSFRMRIEHWELNIRSDPPEPAFRQGIFARALSA